MMTMRDPEAELIHWMLRSRSARDYALRELVETDFASLMHSKFFTAIRTVHENGGAVDVGAVAREVGGAETLATLWDMYPFATDIQAIGEVREASSRRFLFRNARGLVDLLDRGESLERINEACLVIRDGIPHSMERWTAETFEEMAGRVGSTGYDWLVPWMLERGERLMLVGEEGRGKSTLLRQWAYMLAAGEHWTTRTPIPPCRVLVVDAENPDKKLIRTSRWLHHQASQVRGWDEDRLRTRTMASLDLVSHRAHRDGVESMIEQYRPDLLIIGPLYKVGRNTKASYEESALAMTDVLDDWRSRYNISVLMEHHAPKTTGADGERALDPKGSSVWMSWPDVGLKLRHIEERDVEDLNTRCKCEEPRTHFHVGTLRGSRGLHVFPRILRYGTRAFGEWPWVAERFDAARYELDGEDMAVF